MKNIIAAISALMFLGTGVAVNAQTVPYAAPSPAYTVSTWEQRTLADVEWVAKANNISIEEALAHVRHGLDSQSTKINPTAEVPKEYSPTYNPAYNAIQQLGQGFYAGIDKTTNAYKFISEQRHQLIEGSYVYCPAGTTYTYHGVTSSCDQN